MRHNDNLRDKLVTYLQDAHALEHELIQILESQVKDTNDYPMIQARIQQHLDETRMHEQRMADRLGAYQEKPSSGKVFGAGLVGNLLGAVGRGRTDDLSKAARDDYTAEHMEIAAYELLIATAQLYGDTETIMAAQANLRDEVRMAQWLEQHLADTVVYSFREDGVELDDAQIPAVRKTALDALREAQSSALTTSGEPGSAMGSDMPDANKGMTPPNMS